MGWDAAALIMVELCVSVGLIEIHKKEKSCTDEFVEGYKEAMSQRVIKEYWGSSDSAALGDLLFAETATDDVGKVEESFHEIRESIEQSLVSKEWDKEEKDKKIEKYRLQIIQLLGFCKVCHTHAYAQRAELWPKTQVFVLLGLANLTSRGISLQIQLCNLLSDISRD